MPTKRTRRSTLYHWELPVTRDYWILLRRDQQNKVHAHMYQTKRAASLGWTQWTVTNPTMKRVRMYKVTHWTLERDWDEKKGVVK